MANSDRRVAAVSERTFCCGLFSIWPVSSQSFWPRSLVFAKAGVCEEKLSSGDRKVGDGDAGRSPWEESLLCSLDSQP